jgi:kynureninase
MFIDLVESRCAGHDLTLLGPRDMAQRGLHVSFAHPEGYAVVQALIARGVIGDFRAPDIARFGFPPLYVSYADVWDAVEILRQVLDERAWDRPEFQARAAVT